MIKRPASQSDCIVARILA